MENLYKHYKYTLLAASSLHKLPKMIVFQLQSVHQQDEELSLNHGYSHTMLKNDFGSNMNSLLPSMRNHPSLYGFDNVCLDPLLMG